MSFQQLFRDPILFILILASLFSWALIIHCWSALLKSAAQDRGLRAGQSVSSPMARLQIELQKNADCDHEHLLTIMDSAIALERQQLSRRLPILGVIGSTAPYMGLLGTVIGIIQAFQAIQAQNNMSPSVVAGGIASALIATAMGLAVAIPAVSAHHLLCAAIERQVEVWESAVTERLPSNTSRRSAHEPVART